MRNWFEIEQYMLSRQAELLRCAQNARVPRPRKKEINPGSSVSASGPWPSCAWSPSLPEPDRQP